LTWQEELVLQWLLSAAALLDLAQALLKLVTELAVAAVAAAAGQGTTNRACGFETETPPYLLAWDVDYHV